MLMTDPAVMPDRPLLARLWPRLAERLADRTSGPDLLDAATAVGCFAVFTVPVLPDGGGGLAPLASTEAAFGAMAAAPLLFRRRWPVPMVLVVTAVYVAAALAGVAFTPFVSNAGPDLAIAVFAAAVRCRRVWSLTVAGVAGVVTWASMPVAVHLHPGDDQDAVQLIAAAAAWLAGDTVRSLRGYQRELRLLHRRQAAEELRLARAEERLRLSREVHDVVSHSLSTIAVQAGVARVVLAEQPGQAGTALAVIETASRSALDELRGLLRQLRDAGDTGDTADSSEPATPTLADLPALIGRLRETGLSVTYRSTGQEQPYSSAVEFSAYRIVQEALTNVTKHARGAHVRVEIAHGTGSVTVTVADDGSPHGADPSHPSPGPGIGLGIAGMRERAELLGGTLDAAPAADGGFTVTAWLPAGKRRGGA